MGQLRLAGEIAAAINGVIGGWLRRITVADADPALHIAQSGSGDGLRVDVGGDTFRVGPGAVARAPRLELDDASTYLDKDASDNLILTDAVTGTKTLAELAAGGGGGGGGHQIQRVVRNAGHYVTTSTQWVDIHSTDLSITMTTGSSWVRITLQGNSYNTANDHTRFDLTIDGSRQGGDLGLVNEKSDYAHGFHMVWEVQLSSGSHTFRPQWKVLTGATYLLATSSTCPVLFVVEELL
jgi:hypothetical protein